MINYKKMDSKEKGNIGVGSAVSWFVYNRYTVLLPFAESRKYDIAIEKDGIFKTIQCKFTSRKHHTGYYQVDIRSVGSNRKSSIYPNKKDFTHLWISTPEDNYFFPFSTILKKKNKIWGVILGKKLEKYKVGTVGNVTKDTIKKYIQANTKLNTLGNSSNH